jgi:hypothetical protein
MFQKMFVGLIAAATLTSAAMTFAAPAEAHIYPHYWGNHYGYWHHPHFFASTIVVPGGECYWVSRPVRVWTSGGPIWERRHFRVCD